MKNEYYLTINNIQKADIVLPFRYSSIKDASIEISAIGIRIAVRTTSLITADSIMRNQNALFADAIKKSIFIYLLNYSKNIRINKVVFNCNGISQVLNEKDFPFQCCAYNNLEKPFTENWGKDDVNSFILTYKEKYRKPAGEDKPDLIQKGKRRIMASITALITAKSKRLEYERFIYLWMSMNGLYGYVSSLYEPSGKVLTKKGKLRKLSEIDEMSILWQLENINKYGTNKWVISNRDRKIIAEKAINALSRIDSRGFDIDKLKSMLFCGEAAKTIKQYIHTYPREGEEQQIEEYDISTEQYLLFYLPYYLRCTYVHSNKPFPLVTSTDDKIINTLHILNMLLEDYLENTIINWLNPCIIVNKYYPRFNRVKFG